MRLATRLAICLVPVLILSLVPAPTSASPLILNEYNAVTKSKYLDGGDYEDSDKEDAYFASVPGLPDGRIQGNGGNWIELVVTQDHLDIRGWQLRWAETGASDTDGTNIWFGDSSVEQGILTFSQTASLWEDLRSGTILTIGQPKDIEVDTDFDGPNRNFTDDDDADGSWEVVIDLHTDTSFDPFSDDWWIHVSTKDEQDAFEDGPGYDRLIRTVTNVDGDGPGKFSVGEQDWQLTITDDLGQPVCGPIGEDLSLWGGGGINDKEIGKLEADPSALVGLGDYEDGTSSTFGQPNVWSGGDQVQDFSALRSWVPEPCSALLMALGLSISCWRRVR
jgi:hypothetical protein